MGGRGSTSSSANQIPWANNKWFNTPSGAGPQTPTAQAVQPQQSPSSPQQMAQVQQQWGQQTAPPAPMQTTLKQLASMDDQGVLSLLKAARNADMPNHLKDAKSYTQQFVYTIGLNGQPNVVDSAGFNKFLSDNNIPRGQIMARMTGGGTYRTTAGTSRRLSPDQIVQMWATDPFNYIGGKHGGQAYGAGAYFDMNGGRNTGYGGGNASKIKAALDPSKARVITDHQLSTKYSKWAKTHQQSAQVINRMGRGDQLSMMALVTGYNVIKSSYSGYHNVIDREAVTITF